jgi:endonuclease G
MKIFILIILFQITIFAENSKCPQFFPNGQAPNINIKHQELCFKQFVVSYSIDFKNPLYAAEILTIESMKKASTIKRKDTFHQEDKINIKHQANLSAFIGSTFDKGHLIPAADMSTIFAQNESFSMANITPQNANNNRILWKKLETYTRKIAEKYDNTYHISGPTFDKNINSRKLKDGTKIPEGYFKIIYIQKTQTVSGFYCKNLPNQTFELKTIKEIEDITGYKFVQFQENVKNKKQFVQIVK